MRRRTPDLCQSCGEREPIVKSAGLWLCASCDESVRRLGEESWRTWRKHYLGLAAGLLLLFAGVSRQADRDGIALFLGGAATVLLLQVLMMWLSERSRRRRASSSSGTCAEREFRLTPTPRLNVPKRHGVAT